MLGAGLVVDQHGVAVGEGAPAGVLAGDPDVGPLEQERAEGQRLAQRPVDLAVGHHLVALLELAGQLGVQTKPSGTERTTVARRATVSGSMPVSTRGMVRSGWTYSGRLSGGGRRALGLGPRLVEGGLEPGREVVERLLGLLQRDVAPAHQRLGVELAHRALGVDELVHQGLGVARVVPLVVAVPAVADHVDDDVLVERLAEAEGQPGGPGAGLGVVAVDVEDRAPGPSWPRRSGTPSVRAASGAVVKPSWLLMTTWTVPPVR